MSIIIIFIDNQTYPMKLFTTSIITLLISLIALLSTSAAIAKANDEIVIYSSRKEHLLKPALDAFTKETGIPVRYLTGKGESLIERLKLEGKNTQADVFITVDAGNLWYASSQNLFTPVITETISKNIPAHLRDDNGLWNGLTVRARTIVYNSDKVDESELSTYADLADPKWQGRLCLRTSKKVYTKSLVASLLHNLGTEKTKQVVTGWVNNLASTPHAKDSLVMKSILAGQCDVGVVNTYYYARLIKKQPNIPLKLFWANQKTSGTHVNISGIGLLKHADNPQGATQLIEYLTSPEAQAIFTNMNEEFPVHPDVSPGEVTKSWGAFKQDTMNLSIAGKLQEDAVKLMQTHQYR